MEWFRFRRIGASEKFHLTLRSRDGVHRQETIGTEAELVDFLQSEVRLGAGEDLAEEVLRIFRASAQKVKKSTGRAQESDDRKIYRCCDAECKKPAMWATVFWQRLFALFTGRPDLDFFADEEVWEMIDAENFLALEDCAGCVENRSKCSVFDGCSDFFALLLELRPHYAGIRIWLLRLYKIRALALWLARYRRNILEADFSAFKTFVSHPAKEARLGAVDEAVERMSAEQMVHPYLEEIEAWEQTLLRDLPAQSCDLCGTLCAPPLKKYKFVLIWFYFFLVLKVVYLET